MVSIRPPMVVPSLAMRDEDFAGLAVVVEADGDVAFVAGDVELVRDGVARVGEPAAQGRSTMRSTIFSMVCMAAGARLSELVIAWRRPSRGGGGQRHGEFFLGGFLAVLRRLLRSSSRSSSLLTFSGCDSLLPSR